MIVPTLCVTSVRGKSAAAIAKGYPEPLSSLRSFVVVFFDALWLKVFQTRRRPRSVSGRKASHGNSIASEKY
ncbi:hypothetical protein, partial [Pseudomonas viridiflava]|uniref:hypothetical protein n=1 Tax=Pseudomonas viridiflava TaxID=33069 RepID=UPI00197F80B2